MKFHERIHQLRRERGISQEELANVVGVSRQAVQKWESGASTPDIENLSALADYFTVSLDYLVRGIEAEAPSAQGHYPFPPYATRGGLCFYEYKSKRTLWGLPLVHIKFGMGLCRARGIVAIGNIATGLVALGGLSAGLVSLGGVSLGLLTLGGVSAGGIALGGLAVGLLAVGGCAIGGIAFGGGATGIYALGGAAAGSQIAIGDGAYSAHVAIGSKLSGGGLQLTKEMISGLSTDALCDMVRPHVPSTPEWLLRLLMNLAR